MTASEEQRADHLRLLAEPGNNYAFGYLNSLVREFLAGRASEGFLRASHAELQADLKAIREDGAQ